MGNGGLIEYHNCSTCSVLMKSAVKARIIANTYLPI